LNYFPVSGKKFVGVKVDEIVQISNSYHLVGDSTKESSYLTLFKNVPFCKIVYADPPFCLLTRRNKKGKLRDEKRSKVNHEAVTRFESVRDYKIFSKSWLELAVVSLKDDGVLIIWTNFLGKKPIKEIAQELGFKFFYGEFLWGKLTSEKGGNEVSARIYEVALVFSKVATAKIDNSSLPDCWSVITHYDEENEAKIWGNHPNHKPFSSLAPLIRKYTVPGDYILDPFSGSGSTPAAALKLGRNVVAIELREEWAAVTRDRMKKVIHSLD
jgi:DNA modification methylase